jgi:hypothetical protein
VYIQKVVGDLWGMDMRTEVFFVLQSLFTLKRGRDSSVGIATRYGLDGPGIESQ